MRTWAGILTLLATTCVFLFAQNGKPEPINTADDLFNRCSGGTQDRQLCFAYVRGFSDGNRWLLHDETVAPGVTAPQAVCIPNGESIEVAADLIVARFRGRQAELNKLSPFRALSMSLSQRYRCRQ